MLGQDGNEILLKAALQLAKKMLEDDVTQRVLSTIVKQTPIAQVPCLDFVRSRRQPWDYALFTPGRTITSGWLTKQALSPNQREASEAPSDPVSRSVIGQSVQTSSKPGFLTSRDELEDRDFRKHRKIDPARWS